jgi:hypothetical protein
VLELAVEQNHADVFTDQVVAVLIEQKWQHFGKGERKARFACFLLYALVFTMTLAYRPILIGELALIAGAALKVWEIIAGVVSTNSMDNLRSCIALHDIIFILFALFMLVSCTLRWLGVGADVGLSVCSLLLWGYSLHLLLAFETSGSSLVIMWVIIASVTAKFAGMFFIFCFAFSAAFFSLLGSRGVYEYGRVIASCFFTIFGTEHDLVLFAVLMTQDVQHQALFAVLMLLFALVSIFLFAFVIADIFASSFRLRTVAVARWALQRAALVLRLENNAIWVNFIGLRRKDALAACQYWQSEEDHTSVSMRLLPLNEDVTNHFVTSKLSDFKFESVDEQGSVVHETTGDDAPQLDRQGPLNPLHHREFGLLGLAVPKIMMAQRFLKKVRRPDWQH